MPCILTRTTFGITSPLRSTMTVSPICRPSRAISSSLCSVARETVTPLTTFGARCATGVSAPVRPTCTVMSVDLGLHLPRRVFECDGPARRFRREAQPPLLRDAVHLQHHAVDFIGQLFALALPTRGRTPALLRCLRTAGASDSP